MLVPQATHRAAPLFLLEQYKAEFAVLEVRLGSFSSSLVCKKDGSLVSTALLPCLYSVTKHKEGRKDRDALQRNLQFEKQHEGC